MRVYKKHTYTSEIINVTYEERPVMDYLSWLVPLSSISTDAIVVIDPDENVVHYNNRLGHFNGCVPKTLLDMQKVLKQTFKNTEEGLMNIRNVLSTGTQTMFSLYAENGYAVTYRVTAVIADGEIQGALIVGSKENGRAALSRGNSQY